MNQTQNPSLRRETINQAEENKNIVCLTLIEKTQEDPNSKVCNISSKSDKIEGKSEREDICEASDDNIEFEKIHSWNLNSTKPVKTLESLNNNINTTLFNSLKSSKLDTLINIKEADCKDGTTHDFTTYKYYNQMIRSTQLVTDEEGILSS